MVAVLPFVLFKGEVLAQSALVAGVGCRRLLRVAVVPTVLLLYQRVTWLGLGLAVIQVVTAELAVGCVVSSGEEGGGAGSPFSGHRVPIHGAEGIAQASRSARLVVGGRQVLVAAAQARRLHAEVRHAIPAPEVRRPRVACLEPAAIIVLLVAFPGPLVLHLLMLQFPLLLVDLLLGCCLPEWLAAGVSRRRATCHARAVMQQGSLVLAAVMLGAGWWVDEIVAQG